MSDDPSNWLTSIGALATPAVFLPDSDESRNCLMLGPVQWVAATGANAPAFQRKGGEFSATLPIQLQATLAFRRGGLANADPMLRGRAVAVPGPGCTLMGIARSILKWLNTADSSSFGGPLSELDLARGLLAYNHEFLGYTGPPAPPLALLPRWTAGMQLTLPLEFDDTNKVWVSNFVNIRTWAGTLSTLDDPALGVEAVALALPDAEYLATEVTAALALHPDITKMVVPDDTPAGSGPGLRRQLLSNPCAALFRLIEVLRQLRTYGPGSSVARRADVVTLVVAFCESVTVQLLQPLAQSTAGNAALRQLQLLLEDPALVALASPDAAKLQRSRTAVAGALGLLNVTGSSTVWNGLLDHGPLVVPQELPLTKAQQVKSTLNKAGKVSSYALVANVFGYPVEISRAPAPAGGVMPSWSTLSHQGSIPATQWLAAHASDADIDRDITLAAAGGYPAITIEKARVQKRAQVAARIAGAEGGMDSVQAGDNGLVSYGMQQWAAHVDEELTVLFERFRAIAPDQYDLYFASAGLLTKRWVRMAPVSNSAPVASPSAPDVDAANPYGAEPVADPFDPDPAIQQQLMDYFPFFVSFVELKPDQAPVNIPAGKFGTSLGERYAFLMKNANFRLWCARARLAGLMSHAYRRAQFQQSVFRFTRIEHMTSNGRFGTAPPGTLIPLQIATLAAPLAANAGDTTLQLNGVAAAPHSASLAIKCGNEIMQCTAIDGATLTVQRAQQGTALAAHSANDPVNHLVGLAELFSSELGAAAALDIHINAPGNMLPAVPAAATRTPGNSHGSDGALADDWLRRFAINYLATRSINPDGSPWMNRHARNGALILLHDNPPVGGIAVGLSPDPGSFPGWERS